MINKLKKMINKLKKMINKLKKIISFPSNVLQKLILIQEALGRIESRQVVGRGNDKIHNSEFRVFSQWGEDGIIQFLIKNVKIKNKIFVEFGVENYLQSNTRFLVVSNNWSGLVIDGSSKNIEYIKRDSIYWAHNLKAVCRFITKDNINEILLKNGITDDIGILSIDIDGNDYWVWESINCISPRIVICEYNSIFGKKVKVTTPYRDDFVRNKYHFSNTVYGASIASLVSLAKTKGYSLVAGNSSGNNIFFVREDLLTSEVKEVGIDQVYQTSKFREYFNKKGSLTFDDFEQRRKNIENVKIFDLDAKSLIKLKDLELV